MRNWLEREEKRKTKLLKELHNVTNVGSRKACMENVPLTLLSLKYISEKDTLPSVFNWDSREFDGGVKLWPEHIYQTDMSLCDKQG